MAGPIAGTKNTIKTVFAHPIALFLYGMIFAAFIFPMVASALGKVKAKGGILSNLIPGKFTSAA